MMPGSLRRVAAVLLVITPGIAACGSTRSSTAPSLPPPPNAGTIPISGIVYDTAFRAVGGATVEVVDGPQARTSTVSDGQGRFLLSGVFDDTTRFRATKSGHLSAIGTLSPVCDNCYPNRWIYFNLEEAAPPANISGEYDVTLVSDAGCTGLPTELRTRTYAATIALQPPASNPQAKWLFVVTMRGAPFLASYSSFRIGVAADYLGFRDNDGATVVEEVAPNTYLAYEAFGWAGGTLVGAWAGSTITTSFVRTDYCVLRTALTGSPYFCEPDALVSHTECVGNNRLILARR